MAGVRDYQRQRVYDWEAKHLAPKMRADNISFSTAEAVGKHIWKELGLDYPPLFKPLAKQTRRWAGKANRVSVWLPEKTSTRVLIHEIAHSLTSDHEGITARHGPDFVGMFIKLLDRFTPLNQLELMVTLKQEGVDFNQWAVPVFVK